MDTQAVKIVETETRLEECWSMNRSRLLQRLNTDLTAYANRYDILPGLEFAVRGIRFKPDVALLPRQPYDWEADVLRCPVPPVTAIDILTATQALDAVMARVRDVYFFSGVQSAWLLLPVVQHVFLFLPEQQVKIVTAGTLHDPATGVEISLDHLFR